MKARCEHGRIWYRECPACTEAWSLDSAEREFIEWGKARILSLGGASPEQAVRIEPTRRQFLEQVASAGVVAATGPALFTATVPVPSVGISMRFIKQWNIET